MKCDCSMNGIFTKGASIRKWSLGILAISLTLLVLLIVLATQVLIEYSFSNELSDLTKNWRTQAISSLSTSSTFSASCSSSESLIEYQWPGLVTGCDCTGVLSTGGKPKSSSCNQNEFQLGCQAVNSQLQGTFETWIVEGSNPQTLFKPCVSRLPNSSFEESYTDSTSSCSNSTKKKCDSGNSLCFSQCPLTNLLSQADSSLPQYASNLQPSIGGNTLFYTTMGEFPIVEIVTQIPNVCFKNSSSTYSSSNASYYELIKNANEELLCDEIDTRYIKLVDSSVDEVDYLTVNGVQRLSLYAGYPKSGRVVHLYGRRMIAWDNSKCSKDLAMYLLNFYDSIDNQRKMRGIFIGILLGAFLFGSLLAIMNSCECGFRHGILMCCKYRAPNCCVLSFRKSQVSPSICDYFSLFDPCYVAFTFIYLLLCIGSLGFSIVIVINCQQVDEKFSDIATKKCSDDLTNRILSGLQTTHYENVVSVHFRIVWLACLLNIVQWFVLVLGLRVMVRYRRQWFADKLAKRNRNDQTKQDLIMTSEETEEENIRKESLANVLLERQKEIQIQILQADFIQRVNLLNQSMSQFQSSRLHNNNNSSATNINNNNNNTSSGNTTGPLYTYELQRIQYLQQNQSQLLQQSSFNQSFSLNYQTAFEPKESSTNSQNGGGQTGVSGNNGSAGGANTATAGTGKKDRLDIYTNNYFNFNQFSKQGSLDQPQTGTAEPAAHREYSHYASMRSSLKR